jgi:hypothetical protein
MTKSNNGYFVAGVCVLAFILAQTFQELAYRFWLPASHGPVDDLHAYLLPLDQARAAMVDGTILLLIVPYLVIALRYFGTSPVTAALGLIFGGAFVGFEITQRSIDFFVIGHKWAQQFQNASGIEREIILSRFALWNEMVVGWTFPLRLSGFLASCCFLAATLTESGKGPWHMLAPVAFALNALRLLGRLLSTFAGQAWLDGLNGRFYFPAVLVINSLLALWFFHHARYETP